MSITFTISVFFLIDFAEEQLFIPHVEHEFESMIKVHEAQSGNIFKQYNNVFFFRVDDSNIQHLPDYLQNIDVGDHEVFHDNKAFYVLVKEDSHYRYIFSINQSDFERKEWIILLAIIIAMFLSWVVALIVAQKLAKRIIDPIQLLSFKIKSIENDLSDQKISNGFPQDEIGQLAMYFDDYNQKVNHLLSREKMFTHDVSHELRTPLMIINSSCELLLTQYSPKDKSYDHLRKIQSACQEMKGLVSIFLALARDDNIHLSMDTIENILNQQYDIYKPLAEEKGLVLELKLMNQKQQLEQYYSQKMLSIVVSNILRNAIHYTVDGTIIIDYEENIISVQDSGQGIPEAIKNSIFEPFVHEPLTDKPMIQDQYQYSSGIGLGLSIAKRICEKQGWRINLATSTSLGTKITIHLESE